jgi:hypothetical protein
MRVRLTEGIMTGVACLILSTTLLAADRVPPDPQPRWFKGNLHTHSLWSDGDDFPEMIAEWYRDGGYHFLAITDHNTVAQGQNWKKIAEVDARGGAGVFEKYLTRFGKSWVETRGTGEDREVRLKPLDEYRCLVEERGRFLLLNAEEISDQAEGVPVHMNASNLRDAVQPAGGRTVQEAIDANLRSVEEQAKRTGRDILVHLNHPNFGWAITAEDLALVVRERFFEVYNGHPGVNHLGDATRPGIERLWDIANTIRIGTIEAAPLYGVATDDSHNYHKPEGSRPGRGWIMVRATHLSPESLIRAIRAGDCYASSGVALHTVDYDPATRTLALEIAPAPEATYTTRFIGTLRDHDASSKPTLDKEGQPPGDKAGPSLRLSRTYSEDVGKVLATVDGLRPHYCLTGEELYVRAVVTASIPPRDPAFQGQKAQAWTQPVGWEGRVTGPQPNSPRDHGHAHPHPVVIEAEP